jgi:hypothetical protein
MNRVRIIAALFLFGGVLAFAPDACSSDEVKIVDVGLQGYYSGGSPTIVQLVVMHAGPAPATFELRVHVHSTTEMKVERIDTFTQTITLGANEQRVVDVPVIITPNQKLGVAVEEADASGKVVGKDSIPINWPLQESLIAIVCADQAVCQEVQSQVAFSGAPPEQGTKGKSLKFVNVQYPALHWLGYEPARVVILAGPVPRLLPEQRAALEGYVRQGGTLIVIQDRAADPSFLASYHSGVSWDTPSVVGQGKVLWIPSLQSMQLAELYSGARLVRAFAGWQGTDSRNNELDWVRNRLTTRFRFPTITWLFAWLAAYILIAGIGNFMVLRWIDRREWGWVTLPCLSFVFALAMYFSSASNRPREFRAEDITFYWMDENSPVAAVERGERISAPHRRTLDFSMNDDVVLGGDRNGTGNALSVNPFDNGSDDQLMNHWDVKTSEPVQVSLRMLQWSFRDLEFYGVEQEPGTVLFTGPGQLRNDTGKSFTQALYVDKDIVYTLGAVASGAQFNLAAAKQNPLVNITGNRRLSALGYPNALAEVNQNEETAADQQAAQTGAQQQEGMDLAQDSKNLAVNPFDLVELIRAWPRQAAHVFDSRSGIFIGLADEPDAPISLSAAPFGRKGYSVTVVSFERKP